MWLVLASAAVLGLGRLNMPLVAGLGCVVYLVFIATLSAAWGASITRGIQDLWTDDSADRYDSGRIEVLVKTALGVLLGLATSGVIVVLGLYVLALVLVTITEE